MIFLTRGQAIKISTRPPSLVTHACWLDNAVHRIDCGQGNITEEPMVITSCGAWVAPEDVRETNEPIDCMTCLVRHVKYDKDLNERR